MMTAMGATAETPTDASIETPADASAETPAETGGKIQSSPTMKPHPHIDIAMVCCDTHLSPTLSHEGGIAFATWRCSVCGEECYQIVGEINPERARLAR